MWRNGQVGAHFNLHPGQRRAWASTKRIILVLAGVRGGKTSFGPLWLYRELLTRGPGDYLVAAPVIPLIKKAAGPEMDHVFGRMLDLGRMVGGYAEFRISPQASERLWGATERPSRILVGHADDPESLAAMTAKGAWLDEAGQKRFKRESYEEVLRRVSYDQGRILLTTTVYNLGWLKQLVYDPWKKAGGNHPYIDVIQFKSIENPGFPKEEYDRAKATMPGWKFRMMFEGCFAHPAGRIYSCFDDGSELDDGESRDSQGERVVHKVKRFAIPSYWRRHVGLDFGGVNTAAVLLAEDPATHALYAYREYKAGDRTAAGHAAEIKKGEPPFATVVGGSLSEDNWRAEFTAGGLPIRAPDQGDVEVGIDRVIAAVKSGKFYVFDTGMDGLLEELATYSRELDDAGEPTEKIEDKETFHRLDGLRYILGYLFRHPDSLFKESDRAAIINHKIPVFVPQKRERVA